MSTSSSRKAERARAFYAPDGRSTTARTGSRASTSHAPTPRRTARTERTTAGAR